MRLVRADNLDVDAVDILLDIGAVVNGGPFPAQDAMLAGGQPCWQRHGHRVLAHFLGVDSLSGVGLAPWKIKELEPTSWRILVAIIIGDVEAAIAGVGGLEEPGYLLRLAGVQRRRGSRGSKALAAECCWLEMVISTGTMAPFSM